MRPEKPNYALATVRMGVLKARFSLKPIHKDQLDGKEFVDWIHSCKWMENTEASFQWAERNRPSINRKKESYMKKWDRKSQGDKNTLTLWPQDGR